MSRKIAFGGILTALSLIFIYAAVYMPTGRASLYFISALPVAVAIIDAGVSTGISVYFSTSILALLLVGNITGVLPFILFFGQYGIAKYYIERQEKAAAGIVLKLAAFNIPLIAGYLIYSRLFTAGLPEPFIKLKQPLAVVWILGQAVFFLYDYCLSLLLTYYEDRVRLFRINR